MKKILVIRYRFIGDTVLTVPFLRNLRRHYPDAQIDMLAGPVSSEVLKNCPYIDNLIVFDTTKKHRYENINEKKSSFWDYVRLLRKNKYDKVYVLKRSFSSAFLAFMSGIKERIGFDTELRDFLLTKRVKYDKNRHEVDCFLDILKADNVPVVDDYLENWVEEKSKEKVDEMLKEHWVSGEFKVLIHATSGNTNKQWPLEYFAQVVEYLINEKNARIFYTGIQEDFDTYLELEKQIKTKLKTNPVNICGKMTIHDSTALINEMNLVIGVDSGLLHVAASLNIPAIGLYGPMNPKKWQLRGDIHRSLFLDLPCIPCSLKKPCKLDRACLKDIKPELVIKTIKEMADKNIIALV
jgi:heptosyltransferase II